jgi:hypothetical protein
MQDRRADQLCRPEIGAWKFLSIMLVTCDAWDAKEGSVVSLAPDTTDGMEQKGVAIVLRGEGFRDWQLGNNGFNLIKTCGCPDAYDAQKEIAASHLRLKGWLEEQGHHPVHFYGTMYPCSNGESWTEDVRGWYGDAMKGFQLLNYTDETQWSTWSKSLQLVPTDESGFAKYWRVVVLRFDYRIKHTIPDCVLETPVPMDALDIEGNGNYDAFEVFPSSFLPFLLTTVTDDRSAGGIGRVKSHPGKDCPKHTTAAFSTICEEWSSFQYDTEDKPCPLQQRYNCAQKHTAQEQNFKSKKLLTGACGDMCLNACRVAPPFASGQDWSNYIRNTRRQCQSVWATERAETGQQCAACAKWPKLLVDRDLCPVTAVAP